MRELERWPPVQSDSLRCRKGQKYHRDLAGSVFLSVTKSNSVCCIAPEKAISNYLKIRIVHCRWELNPFFKLSLYHLQASEP